VLAGSLAAVGAGWPGAAGALGPMEPDAGGYAWASVEYDFVPLAGVGTDLGLSSPQAHSMIALPWSLPFYGSSYPQLRVNGGGSAGFANTGTNPNSQCLGTGNSSTWLADIAVFWDEIDPLSGGGVYVWHDVSVDRFIVSWEQVGANFVSNGVYV
jgi:hypothetical protein